VTDALFRVALTNGSRVLARGTIERGPDRLLAPGVTLSDLLHAGPRALMSALDGATTPVPHDARVTAPIEHQEVWAAGVTYERSREARAEESIEASVYDRVYAAMRPELFFKAPGWRVRGPGEPIGVRADSEWNVPEPELALVVTPDLDIAGYTIANDVSSRSIEGENPLYLPQAKVYDGSCAIGPAIVPAFLVEPPFDIRLVVLRQGRAIVDELTTTARLRRPMTELAAYLGRALSFPQGAILLTGTGIVPAAPFTLLAGDTVRIEAGPLGMLENPVEVVGTRDVDRVDAGVATSQRQEASSTTS
jgi:2-dehydro-3-deoxy-D-arabinonate dehydratase